MSSRAARAGKQADRYAIAGATMKRRRRALARLSLSFFFSPPSAVLGVGGLVPSAARHCRPWYRGSRAEPT